MVVLTAGTYTVLRAVGGFDEPVDIVGKVYYVLVGNTFKVKLTSGIQSVVTPPFVIPHRDD